MLNLHLYFPSSKYMTYQYHQFFQCLASLMYVSVHVFKKKSKWKLQKFYHVGSDSFLGDSSVMWEHLYMLYRPLLPRLWE